MIEFLCSSCGKKLRVEDALAGKSVKCPACSALTPVHRTGAPNAGAVQAGAAGHSGRPAGEAPSFSVSAPPLPGAPSLATDDTNADSNAGHDETLTPRLHFLRPAQAPGELGRLGPYRILKVLGQGGMGMVFAAEDVRLERPVALKTMLPHLAAATTARQRFLREARATAALQHDHIVTVYQVDEDNRVPFIAMQMLRGEPLNQRLVREGKLSLAETLRIGREIALGLAAAHERGLVHRDIKPSNIWLEQGSGRVKLLDFGLALEAAEAAQLTQTGDIMGTPAYMAPEQAAAAHDVDARCDLFSLGCILYRMSTGKTPFQGPTTWSVLRALEQHNPDPPTQLDAQLPPAFSGLVMQLLAKQPARRPKSAQDVVERINWIESRPVAPVPAAPMPAAPAAVPGPPAGLGVAALTPMPPAPVGMGVNAIVAAPSGATEVVPPSASQIHRGSFPVRASRRMPRWLLLAVPAAAALVILGLFLILRPLFVSSGEGDDESKSKAVAKTEPPKTDPPKTQPPKTEKEPPKGVDFTCAEGGFKIRFPGTPREQQQTQGGVTTTMYMYSPNLTEAYMVAFSGMPIAADAPAATLEFWLDKCRDGFLQGGNGTLTSESKVTLEGKYPGRDFLATLANGTVTRVRCYIINQKLYMISVVGFQSWVTSTEATSFLDSFALLH
jgi:hypothetical protein